MGRAGRLPRLARGLRSSERTLRGQPHPPFSSPAPASSGSRSPRCSRRAAAPIACACRCSRRARCRAGAPASTDLRVYALSRASQQLLEQLDVWQTVRAARAARTADARVGRRGPRRRRARHFDSADIGEPDLGHIVEDSLLRTCSSTCSRRRRMRSSRVGAEIESIEVGERAVDRASSTAAPRAARCSLRPTAATRPCAAARPARDGPSYEQTAIVTHVASCGRTARPRGSGSCPAARSRSCRSPTAAARSSGRCRPRAQSASRRARREFFAELKRRARARSASSTACSPRAAFPLHALHALHYCRAARRARRRRGAHRSSARGPGHELGPARRRLHRRRDRGRRCSRARTRATSRCCAATSASARATISQCCSRSTRCTACSGCPVGRRRFGPWASAPSTRHDPRNALLMQTSAGSQRREQKPATMVTRRARQA